MDPKTILTLEKLNRKTYKITEGTTTAQALIDIIESHHLIISANGTIFDPSKKSIVAEILADWFNLRKQYKAMMKEAYKKGDKETGELYNQKQHAIKILLNSVYGTFAINSWRFTDGYKILSSSITTTGQRFIMETIKHANEIVEKEYFS
jgi:DNA polymerase elongation subunit (family B)